MDFFGAFIVAPEIRLCVSMTVLSMPWEWLTKYRPIASGPSISYSVNYPTRSAGGVDDEANLGRPSKIERFSLLMCGDTMDIRRKKEEEKKKETGQGKRKSREKRGWV